MELPLTPQKRQSSLQTEGVERSNVCIAHPIMEFELCATAGEKQVGSARDDDGAVVTSPASPGGASNFTADNSERETPVFHDDQGSTAPTDCSFSWSTPGKAPCYSPTGTRYSDSHQQPQQQQLQQQQQEEQDNSAELETPGKTSSFYCTLQILLPPILLKYFPPEKMDVGALTSIRGFWDSLSTHRLMLQESIITCFCFALAIVRLVISLFPKENMYACWVRDRTERLMPSGLKSKVDLPSLQWPLRLGPISVSPTGIEVKNGMRRVMQDFFVRARESFWLRLTRTIETLTAMVRAMLVPLPLQQTLGAKFLNLKQQSVQHLEKFTLSFEGFLTELHVAEASDSSEEDKRRGSFMQRLQTLSEASLKKTLVLKSSSAGTWSPSMFSMPRLKGMRAMVQVQLIVSLFLQWATVARDTAVHLRDSFTLYMAELIASCGESDPAVDAFTWLKPRWGIRAASQGSRIFGCGTRRYASKITEESQLKDN